MFSFGKMFVQMMGNAWGRIPSDEHDLCVRVHERYKFSAGNNVALLPSEAFGKRSALLDTSLSGLSGGNLTAHSNVGFILPSLVPSSVCMTLGAEVDMVPEGDIVYPVVSAAAVPVWQATESSSPGETGLSFVAKVAGSKLLFVVGTCTRQLVLQSSFDQIFTRELGRAAMSELDRVALCGDGLLGAPSGILSSSGLQSFAESQITQTSLREAQRQTQDLDADLAGRRGFVADHSAVKTLSTRARSSGSSLMLWEGASAAGTVEGCAALATGNLPSNSMLYCADWRVLRFVQWGAAQLDANPYAAFSQGWISFRLMLPIDILVLRPQLFSACQGVS